MKALKTVVFLLMVACSHLIVHAQEEDNSAAKGRALLFADSLNHAFRNNNWNDYIAISYPGVIRYYGGTQDFREYIERSRNLNSNLLTEAPERNEVIQMEKNAGEWQCVVQKTRQTIIDGRKAVVVSYMVGQSKDEGDTWKYFDVAYNSVENLIYIMPDIFDSLSIPLRQIIFEKDQLISKQ